MKKVILGSLGMLSVLAAPIAANAENTGKFYGSIHGEAILSSSSDLEASAPGVSATAEADYEPGYGIGGAAGYYVNDNIRVEGEIAYREADVDTLVINGSNISGNGLELKIFSGMANGYYNFTTGSNLSPYLGAGVGLAYHDEMEEFAFAYQAMAGIDYTVDDNNTLFAGYRYFATTDFEDSVSDPIVGNVNSSINVSDHILEVGYRYTF